MLSGLWTLEPDHAASAAVSGVCGAGGVWARRNESHSPLLAQSDYRTGAADALRLSRSRARDTTRHHMLEKIGGKIHYSLYSFSANSI